MREESFKVNNEENATVSTGSTCSNSAGRTLTATSINNNLKTEDDEDDGRVGGERRRRGSSRKNSLVKLHDRELSAVALKYAQILAETFFLQNLKNCTYADFDTYIRKAHSALLAFLKSKTLDNEDPNTLLRALYNGRVPENSPLKPASESATFPSIPSATVSEVLPGFQPNSSNTSVFQSSLVDDSATTLARTPENDSKLNNVTSVSSYNEANRTPVAYNPSVLQRSNNWTSSGFSSTPVSSSSHVPLAGTSGASNGSGQPPKKYTEKLKAEASVVQRISELQKEGMWYDKRLPRSQEPPRIKSHWDYLLEEMAWLAADFATERKWKRLASRKCAKMIDKYWSDLEVERARAEKEEEIRLRRIASFIAKEIKNFWSNAQQIVEYKEQSRIEEMKKKALDQQLSYIVDQTEKYSNMLAESFVADVNLNDTCEPAEEKLPKEPENLSDDEFEPAEESEEDDEETIAKEEEENGDQPNSINELDELKRSGQMSLDDLLDDLPPGYLEEMAARIQKIEPAVIQPGTDDEKESNNVVKHLKVKTEEAPADDIASKSDVDEIGDVPADPEATNAEEKLDAAIDLAAEASDVQDTGTETDNESEMEESGTASDEDDASTEMEESDVLSEEELAPEDEEQTMGLASLLQTFAPERAGENHDETLNSVAAMAESFQPKGYTLSSTTVVTKVPFLLHHKLREYQHIGLDWLVTMYEKKLNGILADEMGLGKTIQTIALLAHLACEKGNWGPHLVVVPTSVMLNWEMEFKKWCPGFKILTYYGSIKERRLKRTGWTKPNAFHVCITSYKLVIQDHAVFRRKRWKYLILDEAQNIKNFKSQRWQLLLNFSTQRRLLLTGTPLQNNLMELWSLMHFLMPNVFQSHREFREWFSNPVSGMVEGNSDYNEAIIARLHKVLRPFILRRLKSEVEKQLPQKYEHVLLCRLSKRQRFLYEDFMSRAKTRETLSSGNLLSVINVLMQLRKVCNHPNLFEPRPVISPFQCDGLSYLMPSNVWGILEKYGLKEGCSGVFNMPDTDSCFSTFSVQRIQALKPLEEDIADFSAEMARNETSLKRRPAVDHANEADCSEQEDTCSPPKKIRLSRGSLDTTTSAPRTKTPIPFLLLATDDPSPYLDDDEFVEAISIGAPKSLALRLSEYQAETSSEFCDNPPSDMIEEVIDSTTEEIMLPSDSAEAGRDGGAKSSTAEQRVSDTLSSDEDTQIKVEVDSDKVEPVDDESCDGGDESDLSESSDNDGEGSPPTKRIRRDKPSKRRSDGLNYRRDNDDIESSRDGLGEDDTEEDSYSSDDEEGSSSENDVQDHRSNVDELCRNFMGSQWVAAMNYNPVEFQEAEVQTRSLRNRTALVERLNFINQRRCELLPLYGCDTINQCRVIGELPVMRYYGTRVRHLRIPYRKSASKAHHDAFKLGYEELVSVAAVKNSSDNRIRNHPLLIWRHTKALMNLVWTLAELLDLLQPILKRFILYVPAVSSSTIACRIFRPTVSLYAQHQRFENSLRDSLKQPFNILHPILSSMATQFPDPRLIQYDCGKLQMLEGLLRRLKSESHRVLIFTQMARMLDVLEAFLNYHGHIYLRLDGATRIDQRQILMEKFNSDKRIFCFILSTRSGGIGVNLTGADTVIFYDSDWNPTMDAQAQDRCHRIGQTRDVHIYRLVSEKTIEENILKKSNQKRFLSELAIEGGNFTTAYFKKHSIYELFNVQMAENDAAKRLLDQPNEEEPLMQNEIIEPNAGEDQRTKIQLFESALAAAEDETDVEATRNVQAEAAAELAEFDESIPLEELGDGQDVTEPSAIDAEMESIMAELSKVEIYALKFMERTIDDWSRETVAQAQKELEQQKKEWEMEQARQLELRSKRLGDLSDDEDMITYATEDAENQVWISQGGSEDLMPLWAPPTPPTDEMDVYVDYCHGFLYDYAIIPETSLPPVYQSNKKDKKLSPAAPAPAGFKPATTLQGSSAQLQDEETSSLTLSVSNALEKKSPKVGRRDEPIFPPRSLFDRPTPAMAKLRREHRLQKYNCRPLVTAAIPKSSLGPGAVTFPIVNPSTSKPPVGSSQQETVEWMIAEDNALLQTIQNILEMPLSLLVVNLAQTPNWDLAAEMVNMTSKIYRSAKMCKMRYESTVRPREKGEMFYEQPASAKNKKKSKSFIKVGPPSPSRTGRIVKMSQLMTADNNSQLLNTYLTKFDAIRSISTKRATWKPAPVSHHAKAVKQSAVLLSEHNINMENPISATSIAQARYEVQMERRKILAHQAAVAAANSNAVRGGHVTPYGTLQADPNRISASTISVATSSTGLSSSVTSGGSANPGIVPISGTSIIQTQPLAVSSGTILTSTASEVHKAKQLAAAAAAQQQASTSDLPVIRLNHPSGNTTLQEMIARRAATSSAAATTSTSNTTLMAKRQLAVTQQQTQLQQQLQLLQQHQLSQKTPKIALQVTQIKPNQPGTPLQQGSQTQQLQVSSSQQIIINQPTGTKSQLTPTSQITASTLQLQNAKQVVMAYPQTISQQQKQNTGQSIQIQLSGSTQSVNMSQAQPLQSVSQAQSVVMSQAAQQITSSGIQLQSANKQVVMTGQTPVATQQTGTTQVLNQSATIQIQGPKQVVMAYPSNLPGTSQAQILHTKPTQANPSGQLHVHLHPQNSQGQLTHQGSTVVLPAGLAQALNSVVSSAAITPGTVMTMTNADSLTQSVNVSTGVSTASFTTAAGLNRVQQQGSQQIGTVQSPQGPRTVTMQLIKQQAVGGKTVTRPISDAEINAFLKQHGITTPQGARVAIATAQPGTQAQLGQLTAGKGGGTQQVQVPTAQIITSVGLQKLGYQITTSTTGAPVATVLKPTAGQTPVSVSTSQATGLAFPLSFSSVKTVGQKTNVSKQTVTNVTVQQQVVGAPRRQQPQQPTASKLAHMAQVSQANVPQLIVQTAPKQLQTALNVQSLQSALKSGQPIQAQQPTVVQAQLLTHKSVTRPVSSAPSSSPTTSIVGVSGVVTTTVSTISSTATSTVTIPGTIVTSQGQPSIIRISQQNPPVRTTAIQMIGGHSQAVLLNQTQAGTTRQYIAQPIATANAVVPPAPSVRIQAPVPPAPMEQQPTVANPTSTTPPVASAIPTPTQTSATEAPSAVPPLTMEGTTPAVVSDEAVVHNSGTAEIS